MYPRKGGGEDSSVHPTTGVKCDTRKNVNRKFDFPICGSDPNDIFQYTETLSPSVYQLQYCCSDDSVFYSILQYCFTIASALLRCWLGFGLVLLFYCFLLLLLIACLNPIWYSTAVQTLYPLGNAIILNDLLRRLTSFISWLNVDCSCRHFSFHFCFGKFSFS